MKRILTAHIFGSAARASLDGRLGFRSLHLRIIAIPLFAAFLGVSLGGSAQAAPAAGAQDASSKLIEQGIARRNVGDDEGARRLFEKAYQASHTPRAAAQLGASEYKLALWVEAETHLSEALKATGNEWVEGRRQVLTQSLREVREHLGRVEIVGRPAGAEVEVAGKTVGRLPMPGPLRVPAGEVYVRVTADGFEPMKRSVQVPAEELTRVVADLDPLPAGTPARPRPQAHDENPLGRPPPPATDAKPKKKVVGTAEDPTTPRPTVNTDWHVPAGWISAGTAGLLGVGGIAALLVRTNRINSFNGTKLNGVKRCSTQYMPDQGGGSCPGLLNDASLAKTLAIASFVGAGVAAGAAIIFFATAPAAEEDDSGSDVAFACAPTLGNPGATCLWRF